MVGAWAGRAVTPLCNYPNKRSRTVIYFLMVNDGRCAYVPIHGPVPDGYVTIKKAAEKLLFSRPPTFRLKFS